MVTKTFSELTKRKTAMISFKSIIAALIVIIAGAILNSCKKPATDSTPESPQPPHVFAYPDSILYLRNQADDYVVYPKEASPGKYYGFPEGIEIDEVTGAINVNKSESGLRYRITHVSPSGDSTSTLIIISGINFEDKFYHLSTGDSIADPIYNASINRILPVDGSIFDEGDIANSGGCSIKTDNAKINLAQTVRNGVFGRKPKNDERRDFEILYRLNDDSHKALNKLKVRVYYYETIDDVAPDLLETLQDRKDAGVFIQSKVTAPAVMSINKNIAVPRPPCIIIIAN